MIVKPIVFLSLIGLFLAIQIDAQPVVVDKIMTTKDMKYRDIEVIGTGPWTILVDECEQSLMISEGVSNRALSIYFTNSTVSSKEYTYEPTDVTAIRVIGEYSFGSSDGYIKIAKSNITVAFLDYKAVSSGISFIIKQGKGYIVFFIDRDGMPGAVDTSGKVYKASEAMAFLKSNYNEKYFQSLQKARELGLEKKFIASEALVWESTYFNTPPALSTYWGKTVFLNRSQLFYDNQSNAYQFSFDRTGKTPNKARDSIWRCVHNGSIICENEFSSYSEILSTYGQGQSFSTSAYVGFGGNIYFYVAGKDYTEIFRIRRTWGNPDMYAMAINGYTKDEYGTYVDKVLAGMNKDDLRLLRNHVFALYGYEFKDEALKKYFDKQVWYIAKPGLTTASIAQPAERAALVERVQAEEKKR